MIFYPKIFQLLFARLANLAVCFPWIHTLVCWSTWCSLDTSWIFLHLPFSQLFPQGNEHIYNRRFSFFWAVLWDFRFKVCKTSLWILTSAKFGADFESIEKAAIVDKFFRMTFFAIYAGSKSAPNSALFVIYFRFLPTNSFGSRKVIKKKIISYACSRINFCIRRRFVLLNFVKKSKSLHSNE